ncbi:MAG TPA: serine/threonine-protein kinase [Oligoflexia bacterium]|nr:serine/threonine-protein kinase [Oligoflexia bacterium]HMP47189.1 serine/threonine-protein kinase [Oligoflexia bacterium]
MNQIYPEVNEIIANRYLVLKETDTGLNSRIYKAKDTRQDSLVTLKVQTLEDSVRPILPAIRAEAELLKGSNFPNIVTVIDFIADQNRIIVVNDYVEGHSLASAVRDLGVFGTDFITQFAIVILESLSRIHNAGIVHESINPVNILFGKNGKFWLTDILTSHNYSSTGVRASQSLVLPYVAPEAYAGERTDMRSDIYSLGVSLFFAAIGDLPEEIKTMYLYGLGDGIDIRKFNLGVSDNFAVAIQKATCSDPADRFPTADMFLNALSEQITLSSNQSYYNIDCMPCLSCSEKVMSTLGVCKRCILSSKNSQLAFVYVQKIGMGYFGDSKADSIKKNLVSLIKIDKSFKEVDEVASGQRPLLKCPLGLINQVRKYLLQFDIDVRIVNDTSFFSNYPSDILVIIFLVMLSSLFAQIKIGEGYLLSGLFVSLSLAYFSRRITRNDFLGMLDERRSFPGEIRKKMDDYLGAAEPLHVRILLARIIVMSERLFRFTATDSFNLSRLLVFVGETSDKLRKIDNSFDSTIKAGHVMAHPAEAAQFKRARSRHIMSILRAYELLLSLLVFKGLEQPDNSSDIDLSNVIDLEERVDNIIQ